MKFDSNIQRFVSLNREKAFFVFLFSRLLFSQKNFLRMDIDKVSFFCRMLLLAFTVRLFFGTNLSFCYFLSVENLFISV